MSSFALKWLALMLMVIDHVGAFLPGMPLWMRYVGRCSAPLFLYTLVWGFHYTHNRGKYLMRLYLGSAAMGFVILGVNLLLPRYNELLTANIFSTLLLVGILVCMKDRHWLEWVLFFGLQYASLILIEWLVGKLVAYGVADAYLSTVVVCSVIPNVIYTEGGIFFVILGVVLDRWKNDPVGLTVSYLLCCGAAFLLTLDAAGMSPVLRELVRFPYYQWLMAGALLPMLLYNRRRGRGSKKFFYFFYPAHLVLLHCVGWVLERL